MKFFQHALETLEIEKLVEETEGSQNQDTFDQLYNEVKGKVEKKEKEKESASNDQTPISNDDQNSTDNEEQDDSLSESSDDNPDENKDEVTTESLRSFVSLEMETLKNCYEVSLEGFLPNNLISRDRDLEFENKVNEKFWNWAGSALDTLKVFGIHITTNLVPRLVKSLYKGTAYAFVHLARVFAAGFIATETYIKRRVNSFNRLYDQIQKAQKTLSLIPTEEVRATDKLGSYRNVNTIHQLSIDESTDLTKNLQTLDGFVSSAIEDIGKSIRNDIASIQQLIAYSSLSSSKDLTDLLKVNLSSKGFKNQTVPGFTNDNPNLIHLVYQKLLPGNMVLIAHIPSDEKKSREEWIESYKDSDLFLGVDKTKVKLHDELTYQSKEDLLKLLSYLEKFCQKCIAHQKFYESLKDQKLHQRILYRKYFESIISRDKKVTVQESFVDLVTMKNAFVDKVYLPAAIDIHDYSARIINAYLRFIEKNIRELTP